MRQLNFSEAVDCRNAKSGGSISFSEMTYNAKASRITIINEAVDYCNGKQLNNEL